MNVDELTVGQIKEIMGLLNISTRCSSETTMIGKICMVRTYSAGVHFGEVTSKNQQNIVLKNAKRVWSWAGAASLSQLAMEGSKNPSNCKIAMTVTEVELDQVIEIIPMTEKSINNLNGIESWKM